MNFQYTSIPVMHWKILSLSEVLSGYMSVLHLRELELELELEIPSLDAEFRNLVSCIMDCLRPTSWSYGAGFHGVGKRKDLYSRLPVHQWICSLNFRAVRFDLVEGVAWDLQGGRLFWSIGKKKPRGKLGVVCCDGSKRQKVQSAVIVGAGPAGAMLALLLARQDWKVDVFESKQWFDGYWALGQPDGWNVMLGARAACCLEKVGLKDEVWNEGVLCTGRSFVTGEGARPNYQAYGYDLLAIPQPKLASVLIKSGMSNFPFQISYHFGWALQCLHPDEPRAEFVPSGDDSNGDDKIIVGADLLVGADGLHSKTRAELETKIATFKSSLRSVPAGRHLRLRVPVDVVGTEVDEAGRTHGSSMLVVARRSKLLWGVPNRDGTMGLTLQGIKGSTSADVSKEMQETFPELSALFAEDREASARLAVAPERLQGTVIATSYNYKQIVLLGDAAHSLLNVTHLGTGLALEDCIVLDRLLKGSLDALGSGDERLSEFIASALSAFSEERAPEMAAAAQLCADVSKTNMFQVELQRAILRVVTKFVPIIQPWQKAANTQVVSIQQLVKLRAREILIVRIALVFAFVLLLLRAMRLVRVALKVIMPASSLLQS